MGWYGLSFLSFLFLFHSTTGVLYTCTFMYMYTVMEEGSSSRSILVKLAELAPVLSREAHIVNQLTKNM